MFQKWLRAFLVVLIGLALLANGTGASLAQPVFQEDEPEDVDYDKAFIDFMVPHHQSAIEMAERSLDRIEHPELREMAEMTIEKQQEEVEMMLDWREEWYGSREVPPITAIPFVPEMPQRELGMETMNAEMEIEKLLAVTEPFDLAFMVKMMNHHSQAIEASLIVIHHTERQEEIDLAEQIAVDQQAESEQMHMWIEAWYFE